MAACSLLGETLDTAFSDVTASCLIYTRSACSDSDGLHGFKLIDGDTLLSIIIQKQYVYR